MGLGVQRVALLQSFPQRSVTHDDGVDHPKFVEGELVLAQNPQLLRPGDRTLGWLEIAGQNLHKR